VSDPGRLLGTRLGQFELQMLLGSGGMASVYRAVDTVLHRPVAIKVLSPALSADQEFVQRFTREAQLIARLRHPHVVQVYTLGEQDGRVYMVQELLAGPTLAQQLADLQQRGQRMPLPDVATVISDLASALDAIHALGIVHRDVKPANAIYNAEGALVLTDFGIARSDIDAQLTATGLMLGTPAYLSPEQASGRAITPASDVYTLGVVAFELLTGRKPFESDTASGFVYQHLTTPPPRPSSLRPELSPAVDDVMLQVLNKDPAARFATAGAFATALAQALRGVPSSAGMPTIAAAPAVTQHSAPTQVWTPAEPAAPTPRPQRAQPAAQPTQRPYVAPPAAEPAPARRARRGCGPVLAALALLACALGALGVYAFTYLVPASSVRSTAVPEATALPEPTQAPEATALPPPTTEPTPPPTEQPATQTPLPSATSVPTAAPTDTPQPTATSIPTAAPTDTPQPTATSVPTAAPTDTPQPTATSAPYPIPDDSPLSQVRALLRAGLEDGRAGRAADELRKIADALDKAVASDDAKRIDSALRDLRNRLRDALKRDQIDPQYGDELLKLTEDALK
jgi:serine/threonine-protein kinase